MVCVAFMEKALALFLCIVVCMFIFIRYSSVKAQEEDLIQLIIAVLVLIKSSLKSYAIFIRTHRIQNCRKNLRCV